MSTGRADFENPIEASTVFDADGINAVINLLRPIFCFELERRVIIYKLFNYV